MYASLRKVLYELHKRPNINVNKEINVFPVLSAGRFGKNTWWLALKPTAGKVHEFAWIRYVSTKLRIYHEWESFRYEFVVAQTSMHFESASTLSESWNACVMHDAALFVVQEAEDGEDVEVADDEEVEDESEAEEEDEGMCSADTAVLFPSEKWRRAPLNSTYNHTKACMVTIVRAAGRI